VSEALETVEQLAGEVGVVVGDGARELLDEEGGDGGREEGGRQRALVKVVEGVDDVGEGVGEVM
jgi:hypothetical protein